MSLNGTWKCVWFGVNFSVESLCLKISLDIFKCWLKRSKNLWNFININCSEQFAFGLENQKISLLLNVKNIVVQQEITFSILGHFINKFHSFIKVIVFINSLEEKWKDISVSFLNIDKSWWESNFFKWILLNLVFSVWLTSGEDKWCNHIFGKTLWSHVDNFQEYLTSVLRLGQNSSEKALIWQVFSSETIDKEPVKNPSVKLHMFLFINMAIIEFLFNEISHFLQSGVLNVISSFIVEDLASKQSPEYLEHQISVVILFIHNNFLKTV